MLRETSPQGVLLPQLYVEGLFRANYETFVEAVENGNLEELFSPRNEPEAALR